MEGTIPKRIGHFRDQWWFSNWIMLVRVKWGLAYQAGCRKQGS
jgi:hypothetical protein